MNHKLAFCGARVKRVLVAAVLELVMFVLDSGVVDSAFEGCEPRASVPPRRRYSDSKEFSHEDWKRRHDLSD